MRNETLQLNVALEISGGTLSWAMRHFVSLMMIACG